MGLKPATTKTVAKGSTTTGKKLTTDEFLANAIMKLREGEYKGVHTVYRGVTAAFNKYFEADIKALGLNKNNNYEAINNAVADSNGKFTLRPAKGGAMLYFTAEAPERKDSDAKAQEALSTILG